MDLTSCLFIRFIFISFHLHVYIKARSKSCFDAQIQSGLTYVFFPAVVVVQHQDVCKCANRALCFERQASAIGNLILDVSTMEHEIDSFSPQQNLTTDLNAAVYSSVIRL